MTKRTFLALTVALSVCSACANPFAPNNDEKSKSGTVKYEITGTARHIFVSYSSSSGGSSQTGATVPFTYTWTANKGDSLRISAQIDQADDPGNITVTIFKDGAQIETAYAAGGLSTATASATY
jgi:hypothetical protein